MKEAVIVSAVRTTVGRAKRGSLVNVRPEDLGALVVKELLKRTPEVAPEQVVAPCPKGHRG